MSDTTVAVLILPTTLALVLVLQYFRIGGTRLTASMARDETDLCLLSRSTSR